MHPSLDLTAMQPGLTQREAKVLCQGHLWIQTLLLKCPGNIALLRGLVVDPFSVNGDGAPGCIFEPGNDSLHGRLAATRRTDQCNRLAIVGHEADTPHGHHKRKQQTVSPSFPRSGATAQMLPPR